MTDNAWTDIGPADDFTADERRCVTADGVHAIVFHVQGELYAIENRCPHAGLQLADGERNGLTLTCPYHGYTYNIKNGKNVDDPFYAERVRTFPVRIEAGRTQIQITPPPEEQA